jgi:hypothetical protein
VRRILIWSAIGGAVVLLGLVVTAAVLLHPANLKPRVEARLSARLNLDVTIDTLSVSLLPRPRVQGTGLRFRVRNRPDLPVFIDIGRFWMDVGLLSALRQHVDTVHLDDMTISVPPGRDRRDLFADSDDDPEHADGAVDAGADEPRTVVNHLVSHNTTLRFVPSKPDDTPLVFEIHELAVDDVGWEKPMTFHARLTNPVPRGTIDTTGWFGPWRRDDPAETALGGRYTFSGADLGTIDGIGGVLHSTGEYSGRITSIRADGTTDTRDFSLDLGGTPVPLTTTFAAVIDGTSGTTRLDRVDAKLGETAIRAAGVIANRPGPDGHDIKLTFEIADGRIEDVLRLAIDAPTPMLTGDVSIKGALALPPGRAPTRRRLHLDGDFGLERARFSDGEVQQKLRELSRRSQGLDKDEAMSRVMTDLGGRFRLANGVLRFERLTFAVPGANVALGGTYTIDGERIDLRGSLRMKASMSQAVGGWKSIFLKPFNFIFRKDGAGAVIPIKIAGTRDAPKMGIEMGRVFGGGRK